VQFGYPGETWENIEETIQLVRRTRPHDIGVSVSYPLPGTAFYERVSRQMGAKTNWEDSEDLSMMFRGAYRSEFYRALHDALHAEVEGWNSPWRFGIAATRNSAPVHELWRRVHRLEETCRNADVTEIAQWTCS
jgi:radical SAM superfamily enzyme YgiQ (UPF0313 family)